MSDVLRLRLLGVLIFSRRFSRPLGKAGGKENLLARLFSRPRLHVEMRRATFARSFGPQLPGDSVRATTKAACKQPAALDESDCGSIGRIALADLLLDLLTLAV
jgi:hypothetical protein